MSAYEGDIPKPEFPHQLEFIPISFLKKVKAYICNVVDKDRRERKARKTEAD